MLPQPLKNLRQVEITLASEKEKIVYLRLLNLS